eukprot:scaffold29934_cov32-Attheya_sp.AAC.1
MSPPRNDSLFAADIRHVLSHQTTMNIFDPDNGQYGKITFDLLSEIAIFDMESFLNPQYWNADEMFKSDMIIKNIDQANAANHLECIHTFLRDRESLQTIKGCTAFNLASPDVNSVSPFACGLFYLTRMVSFQDQVHKNGSRFGETTCEIHMDSKYDRYPQSLPTNDLLLLFLYLLLYILHLLTLKTSFLVLPKSDQYDLPLLDVAIVDIDNRPRTTTLLVAIALEARLPDTRRRSSRIPDNSQTLVPHPLICQTTVESFDHNAYSKTKGEDQSDFIKIWIKDVIMNLANSDHETFRALFCLTNPQVYGYLFFRKPRLLTALPAIVAWNGNVKTFGIFHAQFKGQLHMQSLSYLFDATFRAYYLAKKLTHTITCHAGYEAKLTYDQLSHDSSFLHGEIQQAVASSPTILYSINSASNDGIGLYFGFIKKYEFGGSTTITRTKLMAQANVAYTTNYFGGVKQFVDDKITAFHTLNEMDNSLFTTDQSKITGLHDSFQQPTDTWPYAQAITACTDYAKALDLLNNLITIEEHSNRHAAHLSQVQTVPPDIDDDEANILHVNFRDVPPGLQLHNELRNVL